MIREGKNQIFVVLGMHRSGTSAITYSLKILGIGLGENLHPAGFDNPKGFWEDRDCLAINEQLLEHFGSTYDRLDFAWDCKKNDTIINTLKLEAKQIIVNRLNENSGIWGFKDPRTCRLLSFWREVFDSIHCEVRYIITLRNPLSVASSLAKRNGIPFEKSFFLWLQHVLPALIGSATYPRLVVDYDLFMENPVKQIDRIAAKFRLTATGENGNWVREDLDDYFDVNLRHTKFTAEQLENDIRAPIDIIELYDLLLKAAHDQVSIDSFEVRTRIQSSYDKLLSYGPLFAFTNSLEDQRNSLYNDVCARDEKIAQRDEKIIHLKRIAAEREKHIDNLNYIVAEDKRQIGDLHQTVAELETRILQLDGQIKSILNSKSWRLTKPLRYLRRNFIALPYRVFRRNISVTAHWGWHRLPLSIETKIKFKKNLFKRLPLLFKHTITFRNWKDFSIPINGGGHIPIFKGRPLLDKPAKLICFYLPQFHAIPENDAWWGEGFTEWTNVKAARPQFEGHYQPRIPGELGYYNLLEPDVQLRQVELAKLYGIEGFCFYFYWFGGKRLLESPIENFLENRRLEFPFCLCWANENWNRRWDGLENEILIAQQHSPADDLAFIAHVSRYMRDSRYIRIDGRPLLVVYRPGILPSAKETAKRWRSWCRKEGLGDIYLAYTQSFEAVDPAIYGFDAAIEFPPNNSAPPDISDCVSPLKEDFSCTVYDWRVFVKRSEKYTKPLYKLFRSVCPSWDNTARRKNKGTIFFYNSPNLYQQWLENAIQDTKRLHQRPDEQLVFINAWNEWAEGAYLEPDKQFGYSWLQATRDALVQSAADHPRQILIVTHDCHPHGAQLLILETAKIFKSLGFRVNILALDGGKLIADFAQVGKTVNAMHIGETALEDFLAALRTDGTLEAITSTVVSGRIVAQLKKHEFNVLCLIHELPGVIHNLKQEVNAGLIARYADKVVFPAEMVSKRFNEIVEVPPSKIVIRPQGVLRKNPYKHRRSEAHRDICRKHNLPPGTQIVLSIAYVDARKGPDLFVEIAAQVIKIKPQTTFVWIGHSEIEMETAIRNRIEKLGLQNNILFIGFEREPMAYYAAASVYALTSREDPFPNVVLESVEVNVPVVSFEGACGANDFIIKNGGRVANYLDTQDFSGKVCELLDSPSTKTFDSIYSLRQYALDLLHHLNGFPRVSVLVPNYNYGHHLTKRLDSIFQQTYPIYEVVVLDDASSDNSLEILEKYIESTGNEVSVIVNGDNSGSVFRQWRKGIRLCHGDVIWIAEADDLAENEFLGELIMAFQDSKVVLAYSQSKQMDDSGRIISENYLDYTNDVSDCWLTDYERDGLEEISQTLAVKNTIPNVSAVLFKRESLLEALDDVGEDLFNYKVAGDWLVYLHVLKKGSVYFRSKPLNFHRRHARSITQKLENRRHLKEIVDVQAVARVISSPSDETLAKADDYIVRLHEQFEIKDRLTA